MWRYKPEEYGWIGEDLQELRRDFLLDDLRPALEEARVDGTVAVQARQSVEETRFLVDLAAPESPVLGVVGWLPLADAQLGDLLEDFAVCERLRGLRHVVQGEPEGFLDGADFNRGIRLLRGTGLVYDLLIFARQIEEATRFVDRHPYQMFVLDHIAKPDIKAGEIAPWADRLRALAKRPNVACKVSGMVTEADPARWTADQLAPYFAEVLEAFGPSRLMIGTDWPVLTASCRYTQWWRTVEGWIASLSATEQAQILGETAAKIYRLSPPTRAAETKIVVHAGR